MRRDHVRMMPGFTAEDSLLAPAGTYRPPRGATLAPTGAPVTPQAMPVPEIWCRIVSWFCGEFRIGCDYLEENC